MSLSKEAIQHIQNTAIEPEKRHIDVDGRQFIIDNDGLAREIERQVTEKFTTNTLSSIVAYIKARDYQSEALYLQIINEREVVLKSTLKDDNTRDRLIYAKAIVPNQNFKSFLSAEQLNIELQSKFKQNADRDILLQVVGNIKDESVQNTSDDGVSQTVTIKQGVASVASARVPNPVTLTPYSTFQEVEQPERLFIFRMREGAKGALIDTDDNSWQLQAIQSIKEYFEKELAGSKNIIILA
ncbi:hypothetical protein LL14B4_06095 [Lactococcus lactis subsp. lactis]|uniref:Phage protein n=1 Tax=Lactococcus lactis subsp. lactis TaxID=1360 RepID=A0A2Z3KDN2_LACLL|nr:hypothetical protein [Lactococcus lactis]AWN65770.1 hypothetical protein LL14B4_06095 [Lactococcus lactis subsp. lactis]